MAKIEIQLTAPTLSEIYWKIEQAIHIDGDWNCDWEIHEIADEFYVKIWKTEE